MSRVLVNLLQYTGTKGGIETYARELYRAIDALGTDHEFVGYASAELMRKDHSWFPGEVIDSGISGENRFTWALGELFSVSRAAHRARADLIHGPAMFGPARSRVPVVISMHDLLYFSHPHLMQTPIYTEPVKMMERIGARNSTRIITISETSAAAIRTYLHYPDDRIDLIPLAGRPAALPAVVGARRRDDLFLAIGQRSPYKNFETVVRAWAAIPVGERPQLVITGSHGEDPLVPLVAELGLAPWVTLKSWVETSELAELFSTATALIDPTLASGSSLPTLEAMIIELPVLLADQPTFREIGADSAEYYAAGDPADLARAVVALASNPERRRAMARRGLERSREFSWDRVARETIASFESAIAEPSSVRGSRR